MNKTTIYNNELLALKTINLNDFPIIFDVGANIGSYSEIIINNLNNYKLHCFEPVPDFFQIIEKKFQNNKNIILNNIALSDNITIDEFNQVILNNDDAKGCSSFINRPVFGHGFPFKKIKVNTTTIDYYIKENNIDKVDWLKIDVEGYEYKVLLGSENSLRNNIIKIIQFEYGETFIDAKITMNDIINFIKPFNYNLYNFTENSFKKITNWVEDYKYNNYYLINEK